MRKSKKNLFTLKVIVSLCLITAGMFFLTGCGSDEQNAESSEDAVLEQLEDIVIDKPPTVTTYESGENFNSDGMVIIAIYNTGKKEAISDYTVVEGQNLKKGTTEIVISYQGLTAVQPIEVKPAKLQVLISVKRTGNIITGLGKMSVFIDDEEVFTVDNDSTEQVIITMEEGIHTIQTKGQGDKSKKLEFEVVNGDMPNEFYYTSEISNLWGIELEERQYVVETEK